MGKGEKKPAEQPEEEPTPTEAEPDTTEEKTPEPVSEPTPKDVNSIRKVIKVDSTEGTKTKDNEPEAEKKEEPETPDISDLTSNREGLEQKRAILQSIKDFDFQIKKNQEDIDGITQKLDGLSKDLDDLVSLYEIVSEQMNPFVGLSKVTKKRLDALEAFAKQAGLISEEDIELESFSEGTEVDKAFGEVAVEEHMPNAPSDADLDAVLEMALGTLFTDDKVDMLIDEFIENLKG